MYQEKAKEQASQDPSSNRVRNKKTMHFFKPTVEKLGQDDECKYYLIASEVFCLSGELRMLTPGEIADLPMIISWKGPPLSFSIDEKECFKLITDIIYDMNQMQDPEFVSFPVGKILNTTSKILALRAPCQLFTAPAVGLLAPLTKMVVRTKF